MTAASVNTSGSEIDVTEGQPNEEPRVSQFRETYFNSSVGDSRTSLTEHGDEEYDQQDEAHHSMLEVDLGVLPPSSTRVDRLSRSANGHLNNTPPDVVSEHSFETSTTTTAVVDSRIQYRWLRGLSFGSVRFQKPGKQEFRTTAAFVLFWVGFIAPWCWLIGGWYLSHSGEMVPDGQYLSTVSLMWPRGDYKDEFGFEQKAGSVKSGKGLAGWKSKATAFWHHPFGGHSSKEVLPLSVKDTTPVPPVSESAVEALDPWVRRCRIAAIISGVILILACIVTLIVVVGVRH